MDRFIRSLFLSQGLREKAGEILEERIALAALGSYGRREICLGSDVDLLVVHKDRLSPEMSEIISHVLHCLWDAKLDVGHSVLTVQECNRLAMSDFRFLTSVLDARFLLGSRSFYRLFQAAFWAKLDREKSAVLKQFLIHQQKRQEKFSNEEYFVEPDIKEGLGGLRDLHFMTWTAKIFFASKRLREIKRFPVFSHFGLDKLHHSESFLLKVRNHLHFLAGGRREDRLLLSYQEPIAESLAYHGDAGNTGPEKFMRHVHLHLNRIRYGSEEFHVKAMDIIDPRSVEPSPERLPPEFQVLRGNIILAREGILSENPLLILKGFQEANQRGLMLGSGFIWEAGKSLAERGKELPAVPGARDIFMDLVLRPENPKILRLALELGLITLFVPEFKRIRNLAQFSYYHSETVDLHSLKTLEVARDISKGRYNDRWPLFYQIFQELDHPEWLFLVGLLHDIGKGYSGDHSRKGSAVIPRTLKRLGIEGEALKVIPFLVRHHLLLANTAQRRDLNDEKTAVQIAQTVGDMERLKLLFLLTVVDSLATGPMAGNDWKIMLLNELFFKVRRILRRGTLVSPDATKRVEEKRRALQRALKGEFEAPLLLRLIEQVSTRYFLHTPLEDMVEHFRLALGMGKDRLRWKLQRLETAPVTRVILCTYDKPGLFSKMVGLFTLHNISVLSGNIFTLKNGLAFDTYEVTNPLDPLREQEVWEKIFRDARLAVEDELPLDDLITRKVQMSVIQKAGYASQVKKVKIDNEASDFFTLIEMKGGIRTGLLYDLAKEIHRLGLDIRFARITSDKEKMTGVFYVRDGSGQKIYDDLVLEKAREGILRVINAP
jgi:[protein-PII] uridylyltransferase